MAPVASADPKGVFSDGQWVEGISQFAAAQSTVLTADVAQPAPDQSAPSSQFVSEDDMRVSIHNVALQAGKLTRDGLKMAAKGAVFSARLKLIEALELIADARDTRNETQSHSRSMKAGLTALREADDFSRPEMATRGRDAIP